MAENSDLRITRIELEILETAVEKLNYVYSNGRGESLTEEETMIFTYWKDRGKVKAVGPAAFGEIFAIQDVNLEDEQFGRTADKDRISKH